VKKYRQSGFTLIESVISIAIIGVIGLLTVDMLSHGADIYVSQSNRKKFTSQARTAFWHIQQNMRNQSDAENYYQSGADLLSILDGNGQAGTYRILSDGTLTYEKNSATYILSDQISYNKSGFSYFDSNYNDITPSVGSTLSEEDAANVHLAKINLFFIDQLDSIELSTYSYSNNFRFGRKKSYHQ